MAVKAAAPDVADVDVAERDVDQLRQMAEQGNARAQTELGLRYTAGRGVARDDAEAVRWFRQAAEQGNADGQFSLGVMYENGRGVARDAAEAVRWFRQAAEQEDADGQFNLGFMCENGRGVTRDDAEAVRWFRQAAEQGDSDGQFNLGVMYENGRGVARDDAEAVRWFRQAAEQGDSDGQVYLGVMYENGRGVARDDAEAVRWFRQAAEQGDARGQAYLGDMYENGRGVQRDQVEAVQSVPPRRRAGRRLRPGGPRPPGPAAVKTQVCGSDNQYYVYPAENPVYYAQERFDRARNTLRPGTAPYRREQSLYETMFGAFGDAGSAIADAHDKLCDLNWWRSSASGDAVKELLAVPGVDPDEVCNFNNDRIIHQPLKIASFVMLTETMYLGIEALVDAGADLAVRNNSGQSAVSLAEIRYDRMKDRMIRHTVAWCRYEMEDQQFLDEITRNRYETTAYIYIKSSTTGQRYDQVRAEALMDIYRYRAPGRGIIDYFVLCPARGVNVVKPRVAPRTARRRRRSVRSTRAFSWALPM